MSSQLHRPPKRTPGPAEQRFFAAVQQQVDAGQTREAATRNVINGQSHLHSAMQQELGQARQTQRVEQRQPRQRPQPGRATNAWNQAVESKVASGLSREQAIRATILREPSVHQAYLNEMNGR